MSAQQHPFEAISGWLDTLPPDLRNTVASCVLLYVPALVRDDDWLERADEVLREWLCPTQKRAVDVIGKAVTFRALVNFACRNFLEKDRRDASVPQNLWMQEYFNQKGNIELAKKLGDFTRQLPLRNAHWAKAEEGWRQLCATGLSDARLELYERLNPPRFQ